MDFDLIDWRPGRGVVAVAELKKGFNNYPTLFEHKRYTEFAKLYKTPYWIYQYNIAELENIKCQYCEGKGVVPKKELREIKIVRGDNLKTELVQYPDQHIKWIKNL